uniref:Bardet-Biedl syndrome 2 protein homolog n=1 Tax=Phallusia mammillata TaxID=59560 RepID=A0A6F9D6X9_9ASCI|nr:Bardet-Biedl syndrome 2 protein homolog [Phallusia mammillata]
MLVPIFTLKIKHKIHPRMVTVGKYDGLHPCLTCGTTASKVFVHNPHSQAIAGGRLAIHDSDISLLSINQSVSAVCAGLLDTTKNRDALCIGTQTNLLAYDVHDNKDLFYKEVPDGVNSLVIGKMPNVDKPLVVAGGNCTLQGFDDTGEDVFWTVTGDVVSSLTFADFTNDGSNELLVGSEDYDIRVFHGDEIIAEMTETEAITGLCSISGSRFGYALANGTVGVYDRTARYWRIKSKNQVMTVHSFDLDGDGVPELITGWSNGKIDARSNATGEIIFKDNMTSAVAGMVDADYRLDGKDQLICCSVDGEVRGYQSDRSRIRVVDANKATTDMRDLNLSKQNLLLELQNYEREKEPLKANQLTSSEKIEGGIIPVNTSLNTNLTINTKGRPHIELIVSTTNETIVRMVVIFAEGLFDGESHIVHPASSALSNQIRIPLYPVKDTLVELHIQAFVSLPGSCNFHVFEVTNVLPVFSSYLYDMSLTKEPESYVTFAVNERMQRIGIWMNENFLLTNEIPCDAFIDAKFLALRGGEIIIKMTESGQVTIKTDNIDLAGEVIQSLAAFLRLEDLQVTAHFPMHLERLGEIMNTVDNLHAVNQKLAAEMTDHSNLIRSLVVRAEDARLQDDISNMRKGYVELQDLNRELISGYHVRSTNHQELVKSLKVVNQIIQKASQLRVGKFQTQVVSQCREAIKNSQVTALFKIIRAGSA